MLFMKFISAYALILLNMTTIESSIASRFVLYFVFCFVSKCAVLFCVLHQSHIGGCSALTRRDCVSLECPIWHFMCCQYFKLMLHWLMNQSSSVCVCSLNAILNTTLI